MLYVVTQVLIGETEQLAGTFVKCYLRRQPDRPDSLEYTETSVENGYD